MKKGEFMYLIGKTGSGKSSLLKILYCDIKIKEGQGKVVGIDILKIKEKNIPFLRRKLGIVFQDFKLLSDRSVEKNLEFVLKATDWKNKKEIKERISQVLEKVKLFEVLNKFPHELSGGEQQRIAIARALLNEPELILADEPTGNIDKESGINILNILKDLNNQGKTVIMITHNQEHANMFKKVIELVDGKIVN